MRPYCWRRSTFSTLEPLQYLRVAQARCVHLSEDLWRTSNRWWCCPGSAERFVTSLLTVLCSIPVGTMTLRSPAPTASESIGTTGGGWKRKFFYGPLRISQLAITHVTGSCREAGCSSQEVTALVPPWRMFCFSYGHRGRTSLAYTDTQLSVFLRDRGYRACLVQKSGFYHVILRNMVRLLTLVLFRL